MLKLKYLLLTSVVIVVSNNVLASEIKLTFDDTGSPLVNTYTTHTPMELKPISHLNPNNAVKLAAVCALGGGKCNNLSFQPSLKLDPIALCKDEGYTYNSCVNGILSDECPHKKGYFRKCTLSADACIAEGYKITSCSLPSYLSQPCPYNDSYHKSCVKNSDKACQEAGYFKCGIGEVADGSQCPYDSNYYNGPCNCAPCKGYQYSLSQASSEGWEPDGTPCQSCTSLKYKRKATSCGTNFHTCSNGGTIGASSCKSGDETLYTECKPDINCATGGYYTAKQIKKLCTPISYEGLSCFECRQPSCEEGGLLAAKEAGLNCMEKAYYGQTCYSCGLYTKDNCVEYSWVNSDFENNNGEKASDQCIFIDANTCRRCQEGYLPMSGFLGWGSIGSNTRLEELCIDGESCIGQCFKESDILPCKALLFSDGNTASSENLVLNNDQLQVKHIVVENNKEVTRQCSFYPSEECYTYAKYRETIYPSDISIQISNKNKSYSSGGGCSAYSNAHTMAWEWQNVNGVMGKYRYYPSHCAYGEKVINLSGLPYVQGGFEEITSSEASNIACSYHNYVKPSLEPALGGGSGKTSHQSTVAFEKAYGSSRPNICHDFNDGLGNYSVMTKIYGTIYAIGRYPYSGGTPSCPSGYSVSPAWLARAYFKRDGYYPVVKKGSGSSAYYTANDTYYITNDRDYLDYKYHRKKDFGTILVNGAGDIFFQEDGYTPSYILCYKKLQ